MGVKVGDNVICVKPSISKDGQELIYGKTYMVRRITHCECGPIYDVGFKPIGRHTTCQNCGDVVSSVKWVVGGSRFVKDIKPKKVSYYKKFK